MMRSVTMVTGALALGLACCGCRSIGEKSAEIPAADFYVATNGNDAWTGTLPAPNAERTDGPFATLARARDALRGVKDRAQDPRTERTVIVRGGVYSLGETLELGPEDSGTAEQRVIYRACPGETVQLNGGRQIPAEAFVSVTDTEVRDRLDAAVRDDVVEVDLDALGITELGSFPVKFRGAPNVPELFFGNERMQLARWPNEGWTTIEHIVESGSCPRTGDTSQNPGIFEYSGDRPSRWNVDAGVWLHGYYCFDWYAEVIKVREIDTEARRITFDAPAHYSLRQGNPSPRRYRAINVLEELTAPGEYYIDRTRQKLYFLPPGELSREPTVLSTLQGPVIALNDASHVTIRGFILEATLTNGVDVKGGTDNRILACDVRNTRQLGINVSGGTRHRIEACDVHDTGTGGIKLAGGDRKTLTQGHHEAVNCHVWGFSRHQQTYASAFAVMGVGNRVAHCLIHEAPHQAVTIGGNDNIFEYNEIHHVAMETDDCGAFYKGRNPSCRGNIIRHNFWHHIGSPMGHGNAAVYFDDGDGGDFVIGNIFFRCGEPGRGSFGTVFSHGGHDLLAENNIFIECKRALGSSPWGYNRWKSQIEGKLWQQRLLQEVDITKPPYTTHYPRIVGFMDPKPDDVRVNVGRNNVFVMGAEVKSGNWQVSEDENWVTTEDPGFVDMKDGDFQLKPNAAVFERLPGFDPIPFEKIGLYADKLRPNPPERTWDYPAPRPLKPLSETTPKIEKSGPPPVYQVKRAAAPIDIDGVIDPDEWHGANKESAMPMAQDPGGNKVKYESRAWLAYDDKGLYVAVENDIHPDTNLKSARWGQSDAVEISWRPPGKEKKLPITLIRGYGNGAVEVGHAKSGPHAPTFVHDFPVEYKTGVPAKDRWVTEFFIPFEAMDIDPASDKKLAFNITTRKVIGNLWVMWEGTRGHSYDADNAGFLEFVR